MRPSGWLFLTQLAICCALAGSAVLYVHYMSPLDSGYCGPSSGCEAARRSGIGYFGSPYVTLPLFSLLAFGALLALSVRRPSVAPGGTGGAVAALWQQPSVTLFAASGLGAVIGLGLIAYQAFGLEQYCWLCLIVDIAALFCALFAFLGAQAVRKSGAPAHGVLHAGAWLGIAALIVAGPLVWDEVKPLPPIPPTISALYVPGKINVVEFADFECPHCRRMHTVLGPLLKEYGAELNFIRAHRPLLQHNNAQHAARAAICAGIQGQGDAMAEQLFEVTLSPEAITGIAESLRLEPLSFDACLSSEETQAVLARDAALLPDDLLKGLPTTYIGEKQFVGVPSSAALRDALERARKPRTVAPSGVLFASLLGAAILAVAFVGRRRGPGAGA